jgi:hypothetical protein
VPQSKPRSSAACPLNDPLRVAPERVMLVTAPVVTGNSGMALVVVVVELMVVVFVGVVVLEDMVLVVVDKVVLEVVISALLQAVKTRISARVIIIKIHNLFINAAKPPERQIMPSNKGWYKLPLLTSKHIIASFYKERQTGIL